MSLQRSISIPVLLIVFIAISRQTLQLEPPNGDSQFQTKAASLPMEGPCMHPVTIVSAYYPLNVSKHSAEEYNKWMADFFPYVTAPIVLYSPPGEVLDYIRSLRGDLPMTVKVQELWEIPVIKPHRREFETRQHDLDPERLKHNAELYGIWTAKSWMVEQAAIEDVFHSEYFFWVDAGSWRLGPFANWPDSSKIRQLYRGNDTQGEEIILASANLNKGELYVQGGFFGGTKAAIHWWTSDYFRVFNNWIEKGLFAGKEQDLMTGIYNRNLHRSILLRSVDIAESKLFDPWFFFQPFFARSASIAANVKEGLHLDFTNVWNSHYLTPPVRVSTTDKSLH